jgi:hypothetical protein
MYRPQLDKITVAAPCTAEWRWMYGNDRVRFCNQCKLNVYNLSAMTRTEAEDLIRNTEGSLCVRFYRRQDGTIITQNCPKGLQAIKEKFNRTWARVAAALLTFFGSLGMLGFIKLAPPMSPITGTVPIDNRLPPVPPALVPQGELGKMVKQPSLERSEAFIRDRATFKVTPVFPAVPSLPAADSKIVVNITISPQGEVIRATAVNGPAGLREFAEQSAYGWKFQPMKANGSPASVDSRLTFRLAL